MREPDFTISQGDKIYLRRWWMVPRNRWLNVYLHHFLGDDYDGALHTHPYAWNVSVLLKGRYLEHLSGGVLKVRRAFGFVFRWGEAAHRISLIDDKPAWTLFITGPRVREWFFLCPKGRVLWSDFVDKENSGKVGKGCD